MEYRVLDMLMRTVVGVEVDEIRPPPEKQDPRSSSQPKKQSTMVSYRGFVLAAGLRLRAQTTPRGKLVPEAGWWLKHWSLRVVSFTQRMTFFRALRSTLSVWQHRARNTNVTQRIRTKIGMTGSVRTVRTAFADAKSAHKLPDG